MFKNYKAKKSLMIKIKYCKVKTKEISNKIKL